MDLVELRAVVEADLPAFFEHQSDPEALRMCAVVPRPRSVFMEHWAHILSDDDVAKRTVTVAGEVAGYVVCYSASGQHEIGYWVGRAHWGNGVATRALAAFLREEKRRPLRARVAHDNVASIRVLEKCGFTRVEAQHETDPAEPIQELVFELRENKRT